jgi:hypothetical protein
VNSAALNWKINEAKKITRVLVPAGTLSDPYWRFVRPGGKIVSWSPSPMFWPQWIDKEALNGELLEELLRAEWTLGYYAPKSQFILTHGNDSITDRDRKKAIALAWAKAFIL